MRYEDIFVSGETNVSDIKVVGNTISWPDDGWYQLQAVIGEDIVEVCAGTRLCEVPNGIYIVINHTTGMRFEDILVSSEPNESDIKVVGNTISWPDDGWYQVQAVIDEDIIEVCAGTRLCEVPNGTYIVINHTSGERFEQIFVNTDTTPNPDDIPTIRADTWREILRNVVSLINADRALERHAEILAIFTSLSSEAFAESIFGDKSETLSLLGLTMLPLSDLENRLLVDYSCDNGGTLNFDLPPGANIFSIVAANCAIGGDVYDGGFGHNGVGREGSSSQLNNLSVKFTDSSEYSLSGRLSTSFDRLGVRRSIQWSGAAMSEQTGRQDYFVEAFAMLSEVAAGRDFGEIPARVLRTASVTGNFSVSASWTDNQSVQVTTDLTQGGSFLESEIGLDTLPSQWTAGSIEIIAADGSSLSMQAVSDDAISARVEISGIDEPQQVLWEDGYQVRCFGSVTDFPDCQ